MFVTWLPKLAADSNSAYFLRILIPVKTNFRYYFNYDLCLILESLKTVLNRGVEGLGLCANDFSKRKASDCIYRTRNRYQETHVWKFRRWLYGYANCKYVVYVSWLCIMAIYHGYVSWPCIMAMHNGNVSWLCIGAMHFEPDMLKWKVKL